jgi:CheY-like chemotaxis protein
VTHKLLLADDSVTIQRVVELTFSGENVQVVTVGDGEQAIARIPIEQPDIVLADIGMPKRSGYEVAAFVKGRSDLSHIPVLLLAGAFEAVDEARAQQVRSNGILVKPFEPQQVISRVRELIETSQSSSSAPAADAQETIAPPEAASVETPTTRALARTEPDAEAIAGSPRGAGSRLDDFDRLDAAFAELGRAARGATTPASGPGEEVDGDNVVTLGSLPTVSTDAPLQEGLTAAMSVELTDTSMLPHQPAPPPDTAREFMQPSGRNLVAEMFAALFATEQGEPVAPVAPSTAARPDGPIVVTDALVDEVTRRVLERLAPDAANELVARIVSEVAERLVREEISRIKAAAAARL